MFIVEWLFDKMGYQKKIQWTSSALIWEDIEKACPELDKKKRKPAAKKAAKIATKKPRKKE